MPNENEEMLNLANNLGEYIWAKHIKPRMENAVTFYRAKVTSAASNGKMSVQQPYSDAIRLPYVGSAANLKVGQQCVVVQFGSASNAVVLGDATLSNL